MKFLYVCVMIGLGAISCQSVPHENNSNTEETSVVTEGSTTIHVDIHPSLRENPLAAQLQPVFSEYFTNMNQNIFGGDLHHYQTNWMLDFPEMPLHELKLAFGDSVFVKYPPQILAVYTEKGDTLAKVTFASEVKEMVVTLATYNFGVVEYIGELKLQSPVYLHTRKWNQEKVGNITYYFPKTHDFSHDTAKCMQDFNTELAVLFDSSAIDFRYMVCDSGLEIDRLMGFDYKFSMFQMNNEQCGLADHGNKIIYGGNGSEFYPHELVHFFIAEKFPNSHAWFDEGFATYLGGSRGKPLDWHLSVTHDYLARHHYPDLTDPFSLPYQLADTTGTMYALGGLITKLAYEKNGMDSLGTLLSAGNTNADFYAGITEVFGVEKEDLNAFLYSHIQTYSREFEAWGVD